MIKNETIKVYKLIACGSSCMFDDKRLLLDELDIMINDIENSSLIIEVAEMTKEEYNQLPEFEGY